MSLKAESLKWNQNLIQERGIRSSTPWAEELAPVTLPKGLSGSFEINKTRLLSHHHCWCVGMGSAGGVCWENTILPINPLWTHKQAAFYRKRKSGFLKSPSIDKMKHTKYISLINCLTAQSQKGKTREEKNTGWGKASRIGQNAKC